MADLDTIELIQREAKTFTFIVKDTDGDVIDVSGALCTFYAKTTLGSSTYLFQKNDESFTKTNGANGIITVALSRNDLNFNGWAYAILKLIIISGSDEDKHIFKLYLTQSSE